MGNRDIPYGYEVHIENFMDPALVPYAHYGLMQVRRPKNKVGTPIQTLFLFFLGKPIEKGGRPLEMSVQKLDINGFIGKQEIGDNIFIAPCIFEVSASLCEGSRKQI